MLAFEELFRRLNDGDVRYVVVGDVAVVLHGVMRFTADIDLIIDLAPAPLLRLRASGADLQIVDPQRAE